MHQPKRTILVTGASSGIGRTIARELLSQGHRVIGISRDRTKFIQQHANFHPEEIDLSQLPELPAKIRQIVKHYPELDTVVFSAGAGLFGSLEELSYSQIQKNIELNMISPIFITRALITFLKQKNRSDLIYIGSEAALKGSRKGSIYCAAKFALRGFTQALREEGSNANVRVCLINPGMVRTAFFDHLTFEPGNKENNYLIPDDIAEAVTYVINARTATVIDEITLNPATKVVQKK
jgi:NADP-dependent 3-hydroxy acid dehydrogenase YdfG